jgi:hypothetical protein
VLKIQGRKTTWHVSCQSGRSRNMADFAAAKSSRDKRQLCSIAWFTKADSSCRFRAGYEMLLVRAGRLFAFKK